MDYEKELKEMIELLPTSPSPEDMKRVEERELLKANAIIYRADYWYNPLTEQKEKVCKCVCSACKEEWNAEYMGSCCSYGYNFGWYNHATRESVGSGTSTMCPFCGAQVNSFHVSAFGNRKEKKIEYDYIMTVHRVKNHIAVLTWKICKYVDKQGEVLTYSFLWEGAAIIGNRLFCLAGHSFLMGGSVSYFSRWQTRKRAEFYGVEIQSDCIMPIAPELVAGTDAECAALEYLPNLKESIYIFDYLKLWKKYPTIENLIKSGLGDMVFFSLKNAFGYRNSYYSQTFFPERFKQCFNFKKKKPHEILGVEKSDLPLCRHMNADEIRILAFCRRRKTAYSKSLLNLMKNDISGAIDFFDTPINGKLPSVEKICRYLTNQKNAIYILRDYWRMLNTFYGETPEAMLFPKDLTFAHNDSSSRIKEKANKELSDKILKKSKKLKKLCFTDEETGLMIVPPKSHYDFIFEGKTLDHCVSAYAKSHAENGTTILFVRKISAPDVPFYTLEWKNGKIVQDHGYKNREQTEEVLAFEKKWLEFVKGAKKNERNNPHAKQQACA